MVYERKIFQVAPVSAGNEVTVRSLFIREFYSLFWRYLTYMTLFLLFPI